MDVIREKMGSLSREDVVRHVWKLTQRVNTLEKKMDKVVDHLQNSN